MHQKRRRKPIILVIKRRVLMCALCAIATGFFLLVHAPRIFPLSFDHASNSSAGYATASTSIVIHGRKISRSTNDEEHNYSTNFSLPKIPDGPIHFRESEDNDVLEFANLWKPPTNREVSPCVERSLSFTSPGPTNGYLLVQTNGGLNQMRAGICDMVAVARIINATLVVPELDKNSFWHDSSNFSDIFDEHHFITGLANDVRVIKKLPKEVKRAAKVVKQFNSWSGMDYYQGRISKLWTKYEVIRAVKSDSRLANNNLPLDIQKLRCRACYEALRFAPHIEAMGKILVERMKSYGPYVALHLRYEKDMLAFSGCTNDLSQSEVAELEQIRKQTSFWKVKKINPVEQRSKGLCPLTPKEVAMFLVGLGYPPNTPVYIAAGKLYGGDSRLFDLRLRYPVLMNKEQLLSTEELKPFAEHASQMAALDYIVSVESDVFIPTYNGNMARAVAGHRRFLGHRKTIFPDRKEIVRLYDKVARGTINEGAALSEQIIEIHKKRQGSPRKRKGPISGTRGMNRFRSEETFYENPMPECLCRKRFANVSIM